MLKLSKISMQIPYEAKDLLSDFLLGQNASAISEDLDDNGPITLSALFPIEYDLEPIMDNLYNFIDFLKENVVDFNPGNIKVEHIDRSSWEIWKSLLKTVRAGDKVVISPPWEKYDCSENEVSIIINPSMAFGTGHHETTKVCISYIEKMTEENRIKSLLDVGCGSAILSIAAVKLGVKEVFALDTDPVAIKEANENKARNGILGQVLTYCGTIQCINYTFDAIVANISVEAILMMKSELKSRLNEDGRMILSGIPVMRMEELENGITNEGFKLLDRQIDGEWVGMLFKN